MDYGIFLSLEDGLEGLCHQTELSHSKKSQSAKKIFSHNQKIEVLIKEIDLEKNAVGFGSNSIFSIAFIFMHYRIEMRLSLDSLLSVSMSSSV